MRDAAPVHRRPHTHQSVTSHVAPWPPPSAVCTAVCTDWTGLLANGSPPSRGIRGPSTIMLGLPAPLARLTGWLAGRLPPARGRLSGLTTLRRVAPRHPRTGGSHAPSPGPACETTGHGPAVERAASGGWCSHVVCSYHRRHGLRRLRESEGGWPESQTCLCISTLCEPAFGMLAHSFSPFSSFFPFPRGWNSAVFVLS